MIRLTVREKVEIISIVGKNTYTSEATRIFNARHPERRNIHVKTVAFINNFFNTTGNVQNLSPRKYVINHIVRYPYDERIIAAFRQDSHANIRNVARHLNIDKTKIWRCLKRNRIKAFKLKYLHTLFEGDNLSRRKKIFSMPGIFSKN